MKIRNAVLVTLLIALITAQVTGQKSTYGVQVGGLINGTIIKTGDHGMLIDDFNPRVGFSVNLHVDYPITNLFSLALEPGFIQKGNTTEIPARITFNRAYNYVNLPILANFKVSDYFTFSIGPEIAYLTSITSRSTNGIPDRSYNRLCLCGELSGTVGLVIRLNDNLNIGLRYNRSFTAYGKGNLSDSNGQPLGTVKYFNQYLQLFFRYQI